jgi:7-cyano-7-deazaguanine synthase
MKSRSIILLSGGLDSTVSATIAAQKTTPLFALTFDYGQRAALMEIKASQHICTALGLRHKLVKLPFFKEFDRCALISTTREIDAGRLVRMKDVWVPNRNGLFINVAACYAEYYRASLIITGFNREEAARFPDNTLQFSKAVNTALKYSTRNKVKVKSYVAQYTKKQIYKIGIALNAPLELIYSCYKGEKDMCGQCASCKKLFACIKTQ